ncbi:hypothetical protein GGR53DRAFT_129313 [Hypoxylon sp. FL1150]|nr:hypothetical protein GGR53DRAFT_129313 [Hypoxylon sp. FL1150]
MGDPEGYLDSEKRKLLYNLCLTSKSAYKYACPLLYRTVIFMVKDLKRPSKPKYTFFRSPSGNVTPVLLLRTLLERPELRGFIRNILCASPQTNVVWWRGQEHNANIMLWPFVLYKYPSWSSPSFSRRDRRIFRHARFAPGHFDVVTNPLNPLALGYLSQRLLAVLFWYTPNLERLFLAGHSYEILCWTMDEILEGLREPPVPRLSTLYIQGQLIHEHLHCRSWLRSMDVICRNVRRLNVHCFIEHLEIHLPLFSMAQIRELKLVGYIGAIDMGIILQGAVRLETLSIIIAPMGLRPTIATKPFPGAATDINDALKRVQHTLKELEFRICGHEWYSHQLGTEGALKCLPYLRKLERLTTETHLFFRICPDKIRMLKAPNLISLTVADSWASSGQGVIFRRGPESFIVPRTVKQLADVLARMPDKKLKYFRFLRNKQEPSYANDAMDFIAPLVSLRAAVEFSWADDELPLTYFAPPSAPQKDDNEYTPTPAPWVPID